MRVAGLHITDRPSERLKPFQHGRVGAPRGGPRSGSGGGAGLRESLPLHVEVDGGVPVRGRDAGVAEPLTDRDDVDAGAEQVNRRAVPHAVGMEALGAQGRDGGLRTGAVLLEQVTDAESGQPHPAVIAEDRLVGLQLTSALGQQGTQQVGGLRPQRADAFLPPLAVEADLRGCVQPQVGDAQDDDFLDPGAGVEHGGEERIVAAAVDGTAIDNAQDGFDLLVLEVLHGAAAGPLERDGEDALTVREPCGVLHGAVPEERVDRGEAHIAGGDAVVPVELQVLKEREDRAGFSKDTRKPVDRCADYLLKYAPYLRYGRYLAAGYSIATGVIKGACRHLVRDRMELTGARWRLVGAEAVLKLRALRASGDFDAYWDFHEAREYERNHARRYTDGTVPPVTEPPPPPSSPRLRRVK